MGESRSDALVTRIYVLEEVADSGPLGLKIYGDVFSTSLEGIEGGPLLGLEVLEGERCVPCPLEIDKEVVHRTNLLIPVCGPCKLSL